MSTETHSPSCKRTGFRYVTTIKESAASIENGTAGKVVMICKTCPARRIV